jgi:orotidine-5'-phosphate decarboxylase
MIDKLIKKILEKKNPSVVGLDPDFDFIPKYLLEEKTLQGAANAILSFNKGIIDAVADIVPAVKPQIAMYEQFGAPGIDAYIKTCSYAKSKDLTVIGDVKRSDVSATARAYSNGHLGMVNIGGKEFSVYDEDFITVNPYLGTDSIAAYVENCKKYDKGIFVLVKTSNPGSVIFQDAEAGGVRLFQKVAWAVEGLGEDLVGEYGFSDVGAVVGATYKNSIEVLRNVFPNVFFLVPGYGAQGGDVESVRAAFNEKNLGAIINSSRGIISAYKRYNMDEKEFAEAARKAALEMKKDLEKLT